LKNKTEQNAPPLHATVSREEFEKMSWPEQADYLAKAALASGNRYGGRPDLLMKEHPARDFRKPKA
jgi:hypothetical protein